MNKIIIISIGLCSLFVRPADAQKTAVYTEQNADFKRGMELYEQGIYGPAQTFFEKAVNQVTLSNEQPARMYKSQAELMYAICAAKINRPDGQVQIMSFIKDHQPDAVANQAVFEMGDYFYNNKKYDEAIEFYKMIDASDLSPEKRAELKFKLGYSYFVKKKFPEAKSNFSSIKDAQSKYNAAANYYYGMSCYFTKDYNQAVNAFKKLSGDKKYEKLTPYYIAQIYFLQNKYDDAIAYGEPLLAEPGNKDAEINLIVGQSYFEKGDYAKALPYLEYNASKTGKLRDEDIYQLGYAYYQTGEFAKSAQYFSQLSNSKSKLGQFAMYYLADTYLKKEDKSSARNAFGKAADLDFDKGIKEDALFNYAKLSAEMNFDREAITALQKFKSSSTYYTEAQNVMSEVLVNTKDYDNALKIIESITDKTPRIKEAYQKVTYAKGVQLLNSGKLDEANTFLNRSLDNPIDPKYKAMATFWKGEIAYQKKSYDESIGTYSQFLTLAKGTSGLPDISSEYVANYNQGYNYLKKQNFNMAGDQFNAAIKGIRQNKSKINDLNVKNGIYNDALMRAGDCYFKKNKYGDAIAAYDEAIDNKSKDFVYAIYQKAIIKGLQGNNNDKVSILKNLVKDYPSSPYTDEAYFALGKTLMETNKLDEASTALNKLITDFKGKSDLINKTYLTLGLIAFNQNRNNESLNYYKEVIKNNPNAQEQNDALAAIKEIYVSRMGKPDDYFTYIETLPGKKVSGSEKDELTFGVAENLFENAEYENAVKAYNEYLTKYPSGANALKAHYQRGDSYATLKKYNEAFTDYEYVIQKGSSEYYAKSLEKAALIAYNYKEDFGKAYQYYSSLIDVAKSEEIKFEAQIGALRSGYRSGKTDKTIALAKQVIENNRSNQEQKASAAFYAGKVSIDKKDYDNALNYFNMVVKDSDNVQTAEARYWIAYVYYVKKDYDTAAQICQNSTSESSAHPFWVAKTLILLSDVLVQKGDTFNAEAALEAVIENFDGDQVITKEAKEKLNNLKKGETPGNTPPDKTKKTDELEMDGDGN